MKIEKRRGQVDEKMMNQYCEARYCPHSNYNTPLGCLRCRCRCGMTSQGKMKKFIIEETARFKRNTEIRTGINMIITDRYTERCPSYRCRAEGGAYS